MSWDFNQDQILQLLQILAVGSAVITALATGIKYARSRFIQDIDDRIDPKITAVRLDHRELEAKVTIIEQMLRFFEQFIVKSDKADALRDSRESDRDLREIARDKKYDEGWGENHSV